MCGHPKCIYFFHFGDTMEFAFFLCFFFLLANKIFTAPVVGYCMLLYINIVILGVQTQYSALFFAVGFRHAREAENRS